MSLGWCKADDLVEAAPNPPYTVHLRYGRTRPTYLCGPHRLDPSVSPSPGLQDHMDHTFGVIGAVPAGGFAPGHETQLLNVRHTIARELIDEAPA